MLRKAALAGTDLPRSPAAASATAQPGYGRWAPPLLARLILAALLAAAAASPAAAGDFEMDETLTMGQNPIAADIGTWTTSSGGRNKIRSLNPPGSGLRGMHYTESLVAKTWHPQHIVRLPNQNGHAYFVSSYSADADVLGGGGYISITKVDRAYVDPATDLIQADAPGEYIWEDQYTFARKSVTGHWNHPGKMEVAGNLLMVNQQNFDNLGAGIGGGLGTDNDGMVFYDIRDREQPVLLAVMDASCQDCLEAVDIYHGRDRVDGNGDPYWVVANGPNALKGRVNHCTDSILPQNLDPGSTPSPLRRYRLEIPSTSSVCAANPQDPTCANWGACSPNSTNGLTRAYGMSFTSYQTSQNPGCTDANAAGCQAEEYYFIPTAECVFANPFDDCDIFDDVNGLDDLFHFNRVDLGALANGATTSYFVDLPNATRHYKDMSVYVTKKGMVVAYALLNDQYDCSSLPCTIKPPGDPTFTDAVAYQFHESANLALQTPHPPRVVTNLNDRGPGSLRNAISYGGTITFDPSLDGGTITLSHGPLVVYLYDVVIDASALPNGITISGGGTWPPVNSPSPVPNNRVFEISEGVDVTLRKLTIRDGVAWQGAGIRNIGGHLTLEDCVVTNNRATWKFALLPDEGDGGGILNGVLSAPGYGDEVRRNSGGGTLVLRRTTVSNNVAKRDGGGIANFGGELTIEQSTVSGNHADGTGGGLYNRTGLMDDGSPRPANALILHSTFAENSASDPFTLLAAGGIQNDAGANLTLKFSTVAANVSTGHCGAAGVRNIGGSSQCNALGQTPLGLCIDRSIVAYNKSCLANGVPVLTSDIAGTFQALSHYIYTNSPQALPHPFNFLPMIVDPLLAPLGSYGGPTETLPPMPGSPAIDATYNDPPSEPEALIDQRGVPRPGFGPTDVGAVEILPLADALDNVALSAVSSSSSGSATGSWMGQVTETSDGVDAAQSGPVGINGRSTLAATLVGPWTLEFRYKVSAGSGEGLRLTVDGATVFSAAGDPRTPSLVPWAVGSVQVPAGSHQLLWIFDSCPTGGCVGSIAAGADAAWVDDVQLLPATSVSSSVDGAPGSLRAIVSGAPAGSTITFDPQLSGTTITVTSQIDITKDLTIDASALPGGLTISGNDSSMLFRFIGATRTIILRGLTIEHGNGKSTVSATSSGGCFTNTAQLTIIDSTVRYCSSLVSGGAVFNFGGKLTLIRSTVHSNVAGTTGGGIHSAGGAVGFVLLENSTVSGNQAAGGGGGLALATGALVLRHATVSSNQATGSAAGGGILYVPPVTPPANCPAPCASLTLENSIIAGNQAMTAPDIGSSLAFTTLGANLVGNNNGAGPSFQTGGPLIGTPQKPVAHGLAPLVYNGGLTDTMALSSLSPAVDAAIVTADSPATDQRLYPRPVDGDGDSAAASDLGAFEAGPPVDGDGDGLVDPQDNCPFTANASQTDSGGIGAGSPPDGIGNACQCGDVSGNGFVTTADATLITRSLLVPPTATLARPELCNVGGSAACTTADAVIVTRGLLVPPTGTVQQACGPALP